MRVGRALLGLALAGSVAAILVLAWMFTRGPAVPRHVLLISIDTLRADHVGPYKPEAYAHVQTPVLDSLAREGVYFDNGFTAAPTTLNSHTAMFTGLWPHSHGVARNSFVVPEENLFLGEVLQEHGWTTSAFIGAYPLHKRYGFDQGFTHWDSSFDGSARGVPRGSQRNAESVTDAVLAYVDAQDADRPEEHLDRRFWFVHYFDVHSPYMAPEPYDKMYREDTLPVTGGTGQMFRLRTDLRRRKPGAKATSRAFEAQYQGEVTYTDAQIGRLFDGLKQRGLWDDTLVIVTSDHGETFAEHPRLEPWDHGYMVYDPSTRIPLLVKLPQAFGADTRADALISNIDLFPTILDLLGIEVPEHVEGLSFADLLRGRSFTGREHVFTEATKPYGARYEKPGQWRNLLKARAVRTATHKLVSRPVHRRELLFDIVADPDENADIRAAGEENRKLAKDLKQRLQQWDARAMVDETQYEGSHEGTQMLQALGYVEGGEEEGDDPHEDSPPNR